jgi:carbohydrate binding protein with CBM5/12 domain
MTIIYRTSGLWGAGKGANLVAAEVDGNFYDLETRLVAAEDAIPASAVGIAFFEVAGNTFYVHMTDGTIQGPFVLPQLAWNFRGPWLPGTNYSKNDVVTYNGKTYMVLVNHVSAASFDPGANDGAGNSYYGVLLANPSVVIPQGGLTGQYLTKTNDADYVVGWQTPVVFPAQALREAPDPTYALSLADISGYVRCVNASGCTITVPADATLNFPLATEISFRQCTDSQVTLTPDAGVVLNSIVGLLPKTGRNGAVITVKKIDVNLWDVFGLLAVT